MKVLVTGANGFLGGSICKKFHDLHWDVVGCDIISGHMQAWRTVCIDLANINDVVSCLKKEKPELIIHCAGAADVARSVIDPRMDFDANVILTNTLLWSVVKAELRSCSFVFLSSAAVYGSPTKLPVNESALLSPMSPYAMHKQICEDMLLFFKRNHGLNIKIARIFSAYGVGLKKQIFWDMYQKYKKTGRLVMFGTGNESRDYIYVSDAVDAIYLISVATSSDDIIYNVANGEETKIRDAAESFAKHMGIDKNKIEFSGNAMTGAPSCWRADISRLCILGYKRSVSFDDGVGLYAQWLKEYVK